MQNQTLPARAGAFAVALLAVLATVAAAPFSAAARAQSASASNDDDALTILITASRFAETADETLAPVTVITREEIEKQQASTVEEVLRTVPGVALTNTGGPGKQTSLFLRGADSNNVLVLIDGVRVGGATSGLTRFEFLPLDQIEKIEVVRGPRSALYGSEAIGGVIQIFTRRGRQDGRAQPRLSVAAGSHNTRRGDFHLSGARADAWYALGAAAYSTGGFNACRGRAAIGAFGTPNYVPGAGCFADEPDDDGYENQSVSLRGGVRLSDKLAVEGDFLTADAESEFDGGFQNETEHTGRIASAKAIWQGGPAWRSELQLGESKDEADNFKDGAYRSTFNTTREQASWQNDFRVSDTARIIAGVDYQNERIDSSTVYAQDSRDNTGVFALLRVSGGANDFEIAARGDDNSQFGDHATGSVAWGRALAGGTRLTASYGTAFRAPTFNELYFPGGGNPALSPEKSRSFDLGLARAGRDVDVAVNLFYTVVEDAIIGWPAANIDESNITGLEVAAARAWGAWDVSANFTVQSPKNAGGGANDGKILIRRPKLLMNWDLTRRIGRHRIGAELHARSRAFIDAANTRATGGFAALNLRGEIVLPNDWRLLLKVNNALDKDYETIEYYPQDKRNFMATLRWTP